MNVRTRIASVLLLAGLIVPAFGSQSDPGDCDPFCPVEPVGCVDPNPEGCIVSGCPDGQECRTVTAQCIPSQCWCNPWFGTWECTDDCDGGVCLDIEPEDPPEDPEDPGSSCEGANPEGCALAGCPPRHVCATEGVPCVPSVCECHEETGQWLCSDDCGGGICVPEPPACPGTNPQGCLEGDCPVGEHCVQHLGVCLPSLCTCHEETGQWLCADDCGGGVCEPIPEACPGPNPQGCVNTGCPDGLECTQELGACVPSVCTCHEDSGVWLCSTDCGGGVCTAPDIPCEGENPQGCASTGCPDGEHCMVLPDVCVPSYCSCDTALGTWRCTLDCHGGTCVPEEEVCDGPNPQGCVTTGCPDGQLCDFPEGLCVPSRCECDEDSGQWICTDDCNGGVCGG